MDEKLQQIFQIRPLQIHCIAYRSSTNEYRKMIKQACVAELRNLLNVEIKIDQLQLKIPEEEQIPKITQEIKKSNAKWLLKECNFVEEGLKLL